MNDGVVVVDENGGDVFGCGMREGCDVREKLVSLDLHSIIENRVALPIAQDSPAEGCSPFYLLRVLEVSGPCSGRRGASGISGGGGEMARGVEEFYLFVGTDN